MNTKTPDAPGPGEPAVPLVERGRWAERLANGYELVIAGAAGFLLVDRRSGDVIGEFADTRPLFVETLSRVAAGTPAHALQMRVRAPSGETEPGAEGSLLVDLSESALGLARTGHRRVAEA
jgi:hypothetical protein